MARAIMENERPGCGEKVTYTESEKCEAYDIAISAIEKQILNKPQFIHMVGDTKAKFKCSCGNIFFHECPTFPDNTFQFCDKCGQKFDWRSEK